MVTRRLRLVIVPAVAMPPMGQDEVGDGVRDLRLDADITVPVEPLVLEFVWLVGIKYKPPPREASRLLGGSISALSS